MRSHEGPGRASSKNGGDAVEPVGQWTVPAFVEEVELELERQLELNRVEQTIKVAARLVRIA